MLEAYEIGISLALQDGVSGGIALIRRDLDTLDRAIAATSQNLARLQAQAGQPSATPRAAVAAPNPAIQRSPPTSPAAAVEPAPLAAAVERRATEPPVSSAPTPAPAAALPSLERAQPRAEPLQVRLAAPPPASPPPSGAVTAERAYTPGPPLPASASSIAARPLAPAIAQPLLPSRSLPQNPVAPTPAAPVPVPSLPARPTVAPSNTVAPNAIRVRPATPPSPPAQPIRQPNPIQTAARHHHAHPTTHDTRLARSTTVASPTSFAGGTPSASAATTSPQPAPARPSAPVQYASPTPPPPNQPPQAPASFAPPATPSQPAITLAGDIVLDGARVGRWMTSTLARQAARPPAGPTGPDPRQTPLWSGQAQGF